LSQGEQSFFDNPNQQQNEDYPAGPEGFIEPWLLDLQLNPYPEPSTQDSLQNSNTSEQTFNHFSVTSTSQPVYDSSSVPIELELGTTLEAGTFQEPTQDQSSQEQNNSQLSCPQCSRQFRIPTDLNHHIIAAHDKPFKCDVPNCLSAITGFGYKKDLDRHKNAIHPDQTPAPVLFYCPDPVCKFSQSFGKGYSRQDNLRRHQNSYQNKPHPRPK